ncbi:MAG TPA: PBP1A family penicillin-binding protein [Nitrospinaceae bacterium]|jgi:penicillin-binding protein 1A|nr:PBP1A family penicillin-binding protein [Nitrospinaceae bacterium]
MRVLEFLQKYTVTFVFISGFIVISGLGVTYFQIKDELPRIPKNLRYLNHQPPTEIYSRDGKVLKTLGDRGYMTLDLISPNFQKAIIAVEDSTFYEHHGLDLLAILRAFYKNTVKGKAAEGGSTITQQLAKNLFFSFEKSYERKLKELLMAFQIESTFSKPEILEAYANQIYFGKGAYGVNKASQIYFGKNPSELNLLQSAVLAAIPKSPNKINPINNKEASIHRASYVLQRMVDEGYISETDRSEALKSELNLRATNTKQNPDSYFVDYVLNEMEEMYEKEFIHFGGLKIFTTLDSNMQKAAHDAAKHHVKFLESRMIKEEGQENLEVAVVTVDNQSGAIRVLLGGLDYSKSQFNRAVSNNRMPGSSFKPFVYMSAFENLGYHPGTVIVDEPISLDIPGTTPWEPNNFNDKFKGPVILKEALAKSLNVISAKLMYELSPKRVIKTARKFGIKSPLKNNYSLALGSSGVSALELASAYSVIANLGTYKEPFLVFRVEDYGGNTLYDHFIEKSKRFSEKEIYPLLDMMKGVVENGSGRVVRRVGFDHPAGGKTGTTNDFRDSWFTGFTKNYSTSVWVGFDDNSPLIGPNGRGLTGAHAAAPIWGRYMKKIHKNIKKKEFELPDDVRYEQVNYHNGFFSPKKSKDTMRVALHSGVVLPLKPAGIVAENMKSVKLAQTAQPKKLKIQIKSKKNINAPKRQIPVVASIPKFTPNQENLDTQVWYMLNLKKASLGQSQRVPTGLLVNFLHNTKELAGKGKHRIKRARGNAIDHLYRTMGSLNKQTPNGYSLEKVMTQPEITNFKNNTNH